MYTYRSCVLTCTWRINKVLCCKKKDSGKDTLEVDDGKTEAE
jgi:hypothetical protein